MADQQADIAPHQSRGIWGLRLVTLDFYMLELILADHLKYLPPQRRNLLAKNGNFRFLLLKLILADKMDDLPPSGGIWWPRMAI